jgi:hypothetical protein
VASGIGLEFKSQYHKKKKTNTKEQITESINGHVDWTVLKRMKMKTAWCA